MSKILNAITSLATLAMAAVPLAAIPAFVHAEEARIPVGDLAFARPADAQEFIRRADLAGRQLCGGSPQSVSVYAACRDAVRQEAIGKLAPMQRDAVQALTQHRAGPIVRASVN